MSRKHLLFAAALLVPSLIMAAAVAQGQVAFDTSRVIQWFDGAANQPRYASATYPLPVRPPPQVHNTLSIIALTTGVSQVVIPAGSITSGCDVTLSNSFGEYYLAFTDTTAPAVPTAAAPTAPIVTPASPGRGLHLQYNSGVSSTAGYVYHCPAPTTQGVSIVYVGNLGGQTTPPSPTAYISVDVY